MKFTRSKLLLISTCTASALTGLFFSGYNYHASAEAGTVNINASTGGTGTFAGAVSGSTGTFASGLTVSAGGASIGGGINNNSGGITNAGALAGATTGAFSSSVTFPGSGIWNSSGNVGIGTTGPGYKLDVSGIVNTAAGSGFHTATNDSWLPYSNGNNYLRGTTYAFNPTWYDENNAGYYLDPNNTSVFNTVVAGNTVNVGNAIHTGNQLYCTSGVACHFNISGTGLTYLGNATGRTHIYGGAAQPLNLSINGSLGWSIGPTTNGDFLVYKASVPDGKFGMYLSYANPNAWYYYSDARLKRNIKELSSEKGLSAILQLRPVTFNWKGANTSKTTETGFIAQEVQEIFPEIVNEGTESTITNSDGSDQKIEKTLGMSQELLIPYIVKSIQEQNVEVVTTKDTMADFVSKFKEGLIETKKIIVDGIDLGKKVVDLSTKIEDQQKQIDELKATVSKLK